MHVTVNSVNLRGLMDSGASVSCLGKDCLKKVKDMKVDIIDFKSTIKTADGASHLIIGKIKTKIHIGTKSVNIILYLVPNLRQELILGYDFWKSIGMRICLDNEEINEISFDGNDDEIKMRQLSSRQLAELENFTFVVIRNMA